MSSGGLLLPGEASPDEGAPEPEAGGREVISRKELARQLRRQAYQRAKAARAADPKHLAMKEVAKQRRRELYQRVKEQRKARDAELDAKKKASDARERTEAKRQLAERVRSAIGPASEPGRALARDIERALQCADVKDLIEQLRAQSAPLAEQTQQFAADGFGPEHRDDDLS
ncbi:MAG TPA: hypothetical protein VMG12_05570 [Polyangiaceae bacterium]|nr:hypothetical protein [Polyangiaceae bacterium]